MSNKFFTKSDETFTGVDLTSYVNGSLLTKEQFSNSIQTNYLWPEGENYSTNQLIYENDVYNLSQDIKLKSIYLVSNHTKYGYMAAPKIFASNNSSEIEYDKFALYNFSTDQPIDIDSDGYVDNNAISLNNSTIQNEYNSSYNKIATEKHYTSRISNYFDFTVQYKTVTSTDMETLNDITYYFIPFDGSGGDERYNEELNNQRRITAGYDSTTITNHGCATNTYAYPSTDNCAKVYIYWNDANALLTQRYSHRQFDIMQATGSNASNFFRVQHTGLNNYHHLNDNNGNITTGGTSIVIDVCMRLDGENQPVMTMSTSEMNVGIDSVKFAKKVSGYYIEDETICQAYYYDSDTNSNHYKYYHQEDTSGHPDGETAPLLKQIYVYGEHLLILPVIKFKTGEIFAMFTENNTRSYDNVDIVNNMLILSTSDSSSSNTYLKFPDYNSYVTGDDRTGFDLIYVNSSYKDVYSPCDTKENAFGRVNFSSNPGDTGAYTTIEFKVYTPNGETAVSTTLQKLIVYTKKLYPKLQYVANQIAIIQNPNSLNKEFFTQMDGTVADLVTSGNIGFEIINIEKTATNRTYYLNHISEQDTLLESVFKQNVKYTRCYNGTLQSQELQANAKTYNIIYNMSNSSYRSTANGVIFNIVPYQSDTQPGNITTKLQFDVYCLYKPTSEGSKYYYEILPYEGQIGRRYTIDFVDGQFDTNNMTNVEISLNAAESSHAKETIIWEDE